jgi:hypothetical protein
VRHDKEVALLTASALNHIGDRLKVIDDRLRKVEDRQRDHESEPGRIAVSDTPQAGAQTQKF